MCKHAVFAVQVEVQVNVKVENYTGHCAKVCKVCKSMQKCDKVCKSIQKYAKVCKRMKKRAKLCKIMQNKQKYAKVPGAYTESGIKLTGRYKKKYKEMECTRNVLRK